MAHSHRHALPAGHRLHWYEIVSILGQGGFGITYLARDTNLDQNVAIKEFLPAEFATRDRDQTVHPIHDGHADTYGWGLGRFLTEARLLAQFEHPNIVRVVAVFEANNTAYMVMRYEEGRSLDDALKFRHLEGEARLREMMTALLDGLEHVHAAGFIHRDIKPANILIRTDGSPVLIDFGSARQALGVETRTLTALVSPGYAPFEQYNAGGDTDRQGPWTDIYAMGAVLYRAVTGKGPPDAMVRVAGVVDGRDPLVPASESARGKCSARFLAAIDAALAFQAERRPQSVAAWRGTLLGDAPLADTGSPGTSLPAAGPTTDDSPTTRASGNEPSTLRDAEGHTETDADLGTVILPRARPSATAPTRLRRAWLLPLVVMVPLAMAGTWLATRIIEPDAPPAVSLPQSPIDAGEPATRQSDTVQQGAEQQAIQQAEAERQRAEQQAAEQAEAERQRAEQQAAVQAEAERQRAEQQAAEQAEAERQRAEQQAAEQAEAERQRAEQQAAQQAEIEQQRAAASTTARLDSLLAAADADLAALRLTSPLGNNALEKYREVESSDPGNARAADGLDNIVARYVELAAKAAQSTNFEGASSYLDRAAQVLPGSERLLFAREDLAHQEHLASVVRQAAATLEPIAPVALTVPVEPTANLQAAPPPVTDTSDKPRAAVLPCHVAGSTTAFAKIDPIAASMESTLVQDGRYQLAWRPADQDTTPLTIAHEETWSGSVVLAKPDIVRLVEAFSGKHIAIVVTCRLTIRGGANVFVADLTSGKLLVGARVSATSVSQSLKELLGSL